MDASTDVVFIEYGKSGIIRSQMFLKEKYLPTGAFEKLKARLVAGGNQQDKDLYDDISSPTVSTSVVCEMNPALCNRVSSSNVAPTDPLAETKRRMISNKLLLSYKQSITVI